MREAKQSDSPTGYIREVYQKRVAPIIAHEERVRERERRRERERLLETLRVPQYVEDPTGFAPGCVI